MTGVQFPGLVAFLFANREPHGLFLKNGGAMRQVNGLETELQTPLQATRD